jgi:ubiquinone/menaquinone biosynthesis C-methylase UbiE
MPSTTPDLSRSKQQYQAIADRYDAAMRRTERWRRLAVDRLFLGDGATVVDVGCGTGLNFESLRTAVGTRGRVIGIDASPEMIELARERVSRRAWTNVELVLAPVEQTEFGAPADAALFSFTHDVLQSEVAIENVMRHLVPAARVAAVGAKLAPRWAVPVNIAVRLIARRFVTTFEGMDRPWELLQPHVSELLIEPLALGGAYVAWGTVADPERGTTFSRVKLS